MEWNSKKSEPQPPANCNKKPENTSWEDDIEDLTVVLDRLSDKVSEGVEGVGFFLRGLVSDISVMLSGDTLALSAWESLRTTQHGVPRHNILDDEVFTPDLDLDSSLVLTLFVFFASGLLVLCFCFLGWPLIGYSDASANMLHRVIEGGELTIPAAVHTYIFRSIGDVAPDAPERAEFFEKYGIRGEDLLKQTEEITPIRSNIITRTKYEMLVRYLMSFGKEEHYSRKLSILALSMTTQQVMRHIKLSALKGLPAKEDPRHPAVQFCFFRTDISVIEGEAILSVTFVNYVPDSGVWQAHQLIPNCDLVKVRAVFKIRLEKLDTDKGELALYFEGPHPHYEKTVTNEEQGKNWGVKDFDSNTLIRFRDTSPTW